ncbi:hypothetical protein RA28_02160 [Ruegeria sp. ANG-S4]|uniref:hypothetical protein n=1 Tax=Ruegeria sp. ANG-S4 TaxID=1577904 RepID=UPI00057F5386|nr:hypothetical protein [Ruegeria sp. ANG-S4]KIC46610.1 hypothetical protein RA28_02160 [Ruegeria sp. ANG-S4]
MARSEFAEDYGHYLLVGLLYLKAFAPNMIDLLRKGEFNWQEVASTIKPANPKEVEGDFKSLNAAWYACYSDELNINLFSENLGLGLSANIDKYDKGTPYFLLRKYADVFKVT